MNGTMNGNDALLFHFVGLQSGILELAPSVSACVHPSLCVFPVRSQKLFIASFSYLVCYLGMSQECYPSFKKFDKIQDGRLMLIFVPKLDVFTYKSFVTVVEFLKSSEML